jgi:hypothetical protein
MIFSFEYRPTKIKYFWAFHYALIYSVLNEDALLLLYHSLQIVLARLVVDKEIYIYFSVTDCPVVAFGIQCAGAVR